MRQVVSYIRVSTAQQGRSGLGIEAQREALARFIEAEGCEALDEFVEVETGKGADALDRRPQLAAALAMARRAKASVLVAKLDRLSRDVAFISDLMGRQGSVRCGRARRRSRSAHVAPVCRPGREGAQLDRGAHQGGPGRPQGPRRSARQSGQSRRGGARKGPPRNGRRPPPSRPTCCPSCGSFRPPGQPRRAPSPRP